MKAVVDILEERIIAVMAAVSGKEDCAAIVRQATDTKFGDYQVNGVMGLAKQLKTNPRKLAEEIVNKLDLSDICEPPDVAGPGFINLRLKPDFIAMSLCDINEQEHSGIEKVKKPHTIVVDFSSPNIAKQMHVGHLRSTIIGDCICRMLEFLGHNVIRQNHIGDWGLQMGMLLALSDEFKRKAGGSEFDLYIPSITKLEELESLYKEANKRCETDPDFEQKARQFTYDLQKYDMFAREQWRILKKLTLNECNHIYKQLSVILNDCDIRGESFYADKLANVVEELKNKGIAVESDGAICVFPEGFKNKEGERLPFIVQKSDGAYLYATTDLAAIRYRINELKADAIIYVTDSRQKLHFEMLFAVARMAGWVGDNVELSHVMFGSVLGEDGSPLKTRSGENVKLKDLLEEAIQRAKVVVEEKNPELPQDKKEQIAKAVGIGAVKYADFSNNRTSDYVFSFDKMLAMDGNTAPYMQYAYARIKSIERKAQSKDVDIETELAGVKNLNLTEHAELDLAKYLIRYGEAIQSAVADFRLNYLTTYLYELAQKFSAFYTNCPVLDAGPDKRPTRLLLCDLTARTIRNGLSELLGIEVVEQM
jgi:arginyl-tRNA synthetase